LGLLDASGPQDPEMMGALAFLRAGMRDHAEETMRSIADRHTDRAFPRLVLAHLSMAAGRTGEAAQELAAAAVAEPANVPARLFLSRALFAAGRLPSALAVNRDVLQLAPGSREAASDRCALLLASGDESSAEPFCVTAAADPALGEARANLGL